MELHFRRIAENRRRPERDPEKQMTARRFIAISVYRWGECEPAKPYWLVQAYWHYPEDAKK
jgi:hypothetical protein